MNDLCTNVARRIGQWVIGSRFRALSPQCDEKEITGIVDVGERAGSQINDCQDPWTKGRWGKPVANPKDLLYSSEDNSMEWVGGSKI